jgi:hypothetical protein
LERDLPELLSFFAFPRHLWRKLRTTRESRKCGPHHLLHFPAIQPGMENPHPLPIYTSSMASPMRKNLP